MVDERVEVGKRFPFASPTLSVMAAGREEKSNVLPRPSPNPPRLSPNKRIRSSSGTAAVSSPLCLLKKTRYAPDLFRCHSCDHRFPSRTNNPLDSLCSLRSQWRVALLCRDCLARVRSAGLCSYCFSSVSDDAVSCLRCSCRVHVRCVDREHRWLASSRIETGSFTCVDCCAIPNLWHRSPDIRSRASVKDFVKDANSTAEVKAVAVSRAENAGREQAATAKRVANRSGNNGLGAVLVAEGEIPKKHVDLTPVRDEELALRLHLAMNGSRRITRNLAPLSLGDGSIVKKVSRSRGDPIRAKTDLRGRKIGKTCTTVKTVEICTKSKASLDKMGRTLSSEAAVVDSHSIRNDENAKEGSVYTPLKEDCGSCSDNVSSHGDDHSTYSMTSKYERNNESEDGLLPSTSQGGEMEKSSELPGNSNVITDRYCKKYFKRKSRPRSLVDGQLVPHLPISCFAVPLTLIDCPCDTNGLSQCQS